MAAKIVKTEKLRRPACRLVGRRYTEADRKNGSFAHKWAECFDQGFFGPLEQAAPSRDGDGFFDGSYIGAMRMAEGGFEYWIGLFLPQDAPVPEGYGCAELPEEECALFWIYGNESSGELYGMSAEALCQAELDRRGWVRRDAGWHFERYNCPRFTAPDSQGNVILDYGIPLAAK